MKKLAYIGGLLLVPLLTFAAVTDATSAKTLVLDIINNVLVPIIFALAFVVFIWGIFLYFIQGGHNEEAKEKGKSLMLWGLIGFFVMVSVWGLVNILITTVGITNSTGPTTFPSTVVP